MAMYKNLSATTQLKTSAGRVKSITVSSTSSGTIAIYDSKNANTSDPKVLDTLTPSAGAHFYFGEDGLATSNGIYIVVASTISFTIGYA